MIATCTEVAHRDIDYDQSVGKMLRLMEAYGGHNICDPAKIAQLIGRLSRGDDLPLRLLLGGDALHVCSLADAESEEELERDSRQCFPHTPPMRRYRKSRRAEEAEMGMPLTIL